MLLAVLLCYTLVSAAQSARILGIFMTPSISHQVVFQPIWKELSLRGHQVTVFTPNPLNDPTLTNLTEVDMSFSYNAWNNNSIAKLGSEEHSSTEELKKLSQAYLEVSDLLLSYPSFQELINNTKNEQYDLLLVEFLWPLMYAFKDVYNCPMVGISSLGLTTSASDALGNPSHPALEPEMMLPFSTNLSFKERVISTIFKSLYRIGAKYTLRPRIDALAQKYFGPIRSVGQIAQDVSLVIVNSNLAIHNVKPTVPAVVDISGIHIKKPQPLPEELAHFLNNAKEGVIYFSLGSNIKSKLLPQHQLEKIMNAFAKLPYKILWKFENEHLPNKPSNVEIRKWLPQQDVLAHPNIKLFITQAGIQSIDESIYHQVPMVAIPFFGDQRYNAHHLSEAGGALTINFLSFTEDELVEKIKTVIRDPKYKTAIKRLSMIARDQPIPALEKAVWWIEYVIRHDGAPHLRYAAIDMPFYQYYLLDVMAAILGALALIIFVLRRMFHHIKVAYTVCKRVLFTLTQREKSHVN